MLIQSFLDGELEKEKEGIVFTHLSTCQDCREFMKGINLLNSTAQEEIKEFPLSLDESIMLAIEKRETHKHSNIFTFRIPAYVSYALGVVIILLGLYLFDTTREYRSEMREAVNTMKEQNQQIQLIMNCLPEAEAKAEIQNAILVQAKM
jgi:predicted anti-sigma-YlaC factor YlaD